MPDLGPNNKKRSTLEFLRRQFTNHNHLLHHSLIILAGAMIVNLLNYAYQLVMGRLLGPEEYGVLGALFSLIYIITFSFGTLKTVVMRFSAGYIAKKKLGKVKYVLIHALRTL